MKKTVLWFVAFIFPLLFGCSSNESSEPATIVSVEGAEFNEEAKSIWLLVNSNQGVSLNNLIKVSINSSWRLFKEKTELFDRNVYSSELEDGNNAFSIVVASHDGRFENTYSLIIHRSFQAWISYEFEGQKLGMQNVFTGFKFSLPGSYYIEGHTFLYWCYEGKRVNTIVPLGDIAVQAFAPANDYTVVLNPNFEGCHADAITIKYGDNYSLPFLERRGYEFLGWFRDDSSISFPISGIWNYGNGLTLNAKWEPFSYAISYALNGGTNNPENPNSYTVENRAVLAEPTCKFKTFDGWYLDGKRIRFIPEGTTGEIKLEALWSQNDVQKAEEEAAKVDREKRLGIRPVFSDDGKTVTYGLYPQKRICDEKTIASLEALRTPHELYEGENEFVFFDGNYYVVLNINFRGLGGTVYWEDGSESGRYDFASHKGNLEWFICEPIKWMVLSNFNGELFVVSERILDASVWNNVQVYSGGYELSYLRLWLNGFYESAFKLGDDYSLITEVNNGRGGSVDDRVFVLSSKDLKDYFTDKESRCAQTTDWARARKTNYQRANFLGDYWARSIYSYEGRAYSLSGEAVVYSSGNIGEGNGSLNDWSMGVRPAMRIRIDK